MTTKFLRADVARVMSAVCEDAREAHATAFRLADLDPAGHTALTEEPLNGRDAPCIKCGHINEAEYMVAELLA